jgi:hypothetical protein
VAEGEAEGSEGVGRSLGDPEGDPPPRGDAVAACEGEPLAQPLALREARGEG